MIPFFTQLYGNFAYEEIKKYVLLGSMLALITGIYRALSTLAEVFVLDIVGATYVPSVKLWSGIFVILLVPLYGWLVKVYNRDKAFYILAGIYGSLALIFAALMLRSRFGLDLLADLTKILRCTFS